MSSRLFATASSSSRRTRDRSSPRLVSLPTHQSVVTSSSPARTGHSARARTLAHAKSRPSPRRCKTTTTATGSHPGVRGARRRGTRARAPVVRIALRRSTTIIFGHAPPRRPRAIAPSFKSSRRHARRQPQGARHDGSAHEASSRRPTSAPRYCVGLVVSIDDDAPQTLVPREGVPRRRRRRPTGAHRSTDRRLTRRRIRAALSDLGVDRPMIRSARAPVTSPPSHGRFVGRRINAKGRRRRDFEDPARRRRRRSHGRRQGLRLGRGKIVMSRLESSTRGTDSVGCTNAHSPTSTARVMTPADVASHFVRGLRSVANVASPVTQPRTERPLKSTRTRSQPRRDRYVGDEVVERTINRRDFGDDSTARAAPTARATVLGAGRSPVRSAPR